MITNSWGNHSITRSKTFSAHSRENNLFSFLGTLIWFEKFHIPLESVCWLFVAYCHAFFYEGIINSLMDLFSLWRGNFKNLLFNLLIIGWSSAKLSYFQVTRYQKDEYFEEYTQTYYKALNQKLVVSQ